MERNDPKFYKRMDLNMSDPGFLRQVAHALSTDLRLEILKMIADKSMNVVELATALDVPVSTIAVNIGILEKAQLIKTEQVPGIHGKQKRCTKVTDYISVDLNEYNENAPQTGELSMPIGAFCRCEGILPSCGLASAADFIGVQDEPLCFYDIERIDAQIIWFHQGYIEYRFPILKLRSPNLEKIEILFEGCSEAIGYNNTYKSDITLSINDVDIGVWESPGDFGGRRGLLNPDWWPAFSSQYGMLKNWRITREGSLLDGIPISDVCLHDLQIERRNYLSLRLGVRPDARHVGGMNLFGRGFGDYPQDIVLRYFIS